MRKLALSLIVALSLFGCEQQQPTVSKKISNESIELSKALINEDKSKLELYYKQFSGASAFLRNTEEVKNTAEFDKMMLDFKKIYKESGTIESINNFFVSKGYEDVKKLIGQDREKLIQDIDTVSAAILEAIKDK